MNIRLHEGLPFVSVEITFRQQQIIPPVQI